MIAQAKTSVKIHRVYGCIQGEVERLFPIIAPPDKFLTFMLLFVILSWLFANDILVFDTTTVVYPIVYEHFYFIFVTVTGWLVRITPECHSCAGRNPLFT